MNGFLTGPTGLYLFLFVLPGILGALVYEYMVEGEPRDTLDRIASALVLALMSSLASSTLFGEALVPHIDIRTETSPDVILGAFLQPRHLLLTTLISAVIAAVFAVAQNKGWLYRWLRSYKLTKKTGRNDVWQQTFYLLDERWLSLEFKDGRCLVGWPLRFSSSGQPRALLLGDAVWYTLAQDGSYIEREVLGPGVYISDFADVISMEFLD